MKRTRVLIASVVTAVAIGAVATYARRDPTVPQVVTDIVSRGAIVSQVSASGTLEAVTTVQVGTQVSGTVRELYADFNSLVRKGQVLARLEPSLLEAEIAQARANLVRAEAEAERLQVAVADARAKLERARELSDRELIPAADLDAADVAVRSAEAQLRSAQAQVTQARASLSQAEVNLQKTVILSPIAGIVIARNVDVGQTVAASLQAPTLFQIAADLREMQVRASVDESDVGQVREGQRVRFSVDAYPGVEFAGTVRQVRLTPVVEQNVVTYAAIISAANPDLKLRPGMTATVLVETARRENVLRVPSAALRFRPTSDVLARIGKGQAAATAATQVSASGASGAAGASTGTLWTYDGGLRPVPVRTGASDGTYTEILEGAELVEGTSVAMQVVQEGAARAASTGSNPLLGSTPRRF
ncbi:MAG TPA: efflux RND transporter periplasmic adaptor subunit [Vicinamibacterales bacterium]|nr:efflux RND transporter periplasmic adaptor subunit [Vicinamibacterales bacterium]